VAASYPIISMAVAALELGILTISPATYFALPDGAVVTTPVGVVVFFVLELSVQPLIRTQEIRSTARPDTRSVFLFMVLTETGDYFKKSFYPLHLFHCHKSKKNS
jgi:hypothetical protein